MHLHPTQNPLPTSQPVEVSDPTSFLSHNLARISQRPLPLSPTRESSGSPAAIHSVHSREIRLLLPFAACIRRYAHMAAG